MAAPTDYFVDPLNGTDDLDVGPPARGTDPARPWLTVQYALTTGILARDAANGDQVNIKSDQIPGVVTTTDDVLGATLNLVAYGAPTADAPLIFRGYYEAVGDRGIGGLDGDNLGFSVMDSNVVVKDYIHFIDMHCHNTGANEILYLRNRSSIINCILDTTTNQEAFLVGTYGSVSGNYLEGGGATYVGQLGGSSWCYGNMIRNAGAGGGIFLAGAGANAARNIIVLDGAASWGIRVSQDLQRIVGNSILHTNVGTAAGIYFDAPGHASCSILDNLIEGFSGVGGSGIDFGNLTEHVHLYANNGFHDNDGNDERNRGDINYEADNDLDMADSPFLKDGALTWANRFNYFKGVLSAGDTRGGAYPNGCRFDRGAVQVRIATERVIPAKTITSVPQRTVFDFVTD